MGTLVGGVDCSTQATKVVVVDAESGEVVGAGRADHVVSGSAGATHLAAVPQVKLVKHNGDGSALYELAP